ncbi:MAG TPA: cytochrome c peroxidase, partial [Longimicrobiales bacterium]|nr:cytochrome c peroxidase [Longimicrobiales bacterium]
MKFSSNQIVWRVSAIALAALTSACGPSNRTAMEEQKVVTNGRFAPLPDRMPGSENDTPELIALGRMLYHDPILSINHTQSCNTCHRLDRGLSGVDYRSTSLGARGELGARNAPTVLNAGYQPAQFWDARAHDLAAQAAGPPLNPIEMGMPDESAIERRLRAEARYRTSFAQAYPGVTQPITYENVTGAIAAFERTLISEGRLDNYLRGEVAALDVEEQAGMRHFGSLGCTVCHAGALLGGDRLMKMGLVEEYKASADTGAGGGRFKVSQLRNATLTPPYFHDGGVATIAEAIDQMAVLQLGRDLSRAELIQITRFLGSAADRTLTVAESWTDPDAWTPRDPAGVPAGLPREGLRLLSSSHAFSRTGSALSCTSCHQSQGTKKYGLPWVGVSARYPRYHARAGQPADLAQRINGCLERSVNTSPLPVDSRRMRAM